MDAGHVVFGASGALGSAIVRWLTGEEKPVRALVRRKGLAALPPLTEVFEGDAADVASARAACRNAAVVHSPVGVLKETGVGRPVRAGRGGKGLRRFP